jgi:uncharacterized protein
VESSNILNYNPAMEYRQLGKTGIPISAVALGGHWKRVGEAALGRPFRGGGYDQEDFDNIHSPDLMKNRDAVVSRAIELGINYVDACAGPEILAYAKVLKGRRDRMYLGYSWHTRESRFADYQSAASLMKGLDEGMREAGLDYVDLWRISLPMDGVENKDQLRAVEEGAVEALQRARSQGKVRFTGVSTHNRNWLRSVVEKYSDIIQVILFPYTAGSRARQQGSLFEAIQSAGVGAIGIKPFAGSALFLGDSSPSGEHAAEDDRRARLAIRGVLSNPALSSTLPGCASVHQLENAVDAVAGTRALSAGELENFEESTRHMWSNLPPYQEFLRDWREV